MSESGLAALSPRKFEIPVTDREKGERHVLEPLLVDHRRVEERTEAFGGGCRVACSDSGVVELHSPASRGVDITHTALLATKDSCVMSSITCTDD